MKKEHGSFWLFLVCFVVFLPVAVMAMPVIGQFGGPDRYRNKLELKDFTVQGPVPTPVGSQLTVSFTLKNVSEQPIQFDPRYGVFIGCRWNSTSNQNNRDFGHSYKGKVLMPFEGIYVQGRIIVDQGGTWRFWPAFHTGGTWGPFRWHEVTVKVQGSGNQGTDPRRPRPGQRPPRP